MFDEAAQRNVAYYAVALLGEVQLVDVGEIELSRHVGGGDERANKEGKNKTCDSGRVEVGGEGNDLRVRGGKLQVGEPLEGLRDRQLISNQRGSYG